MEKLRALLFLLRSKLRRSAQPGEVLCLVDFHSHTRGGHFAVWLQRFALEFSSRFDRVIVLVPDPFKAASLFVREKQACPRNICVRKLPRNVSGNFSLANLKQLPAMSNSRLSAFVMWGKDLKKPEWFELATSVPWGTLMGVSWATRGHDNPPALAELYLTEKFGKDPLFRGFLQPDFFVDKRHDTSFWLPFFEATDLPGRTTKQQEAIAKHREGRLCVGFIGILTGFRGLDEFLSLALANPQVAFVAAGPLVEDSVNPGKRALLGPKKPANLMILKGFIKDPETLNSVVNAVDAVFVDGRRYPVHSSIACRAMHFGKALVTPVSDSWACDVVRTWGAGISYSAGEKDMINRLLQWQRGDGSNNCLRAAAILNNRETLGACFDMISNRLKAAS